MVDNLGWSGRRWVFIDFITNSTYDYVMAWQCIPHHWPFVRGIHPPPMDFHQNGSVMGQCGNLMFAATSCRINSCISGDLRHLGTHMLRADSMFAANQWETSLQCNAVSHWLGANIESALYGVAVMSMSHKTYPWVCCARFWWSYIILLSGLVWYFATFFRVGLPAPE